MTKMEIATYLGISTALLAQMERTGDAADEILFNIRQATQEAQLIMYELTREEIISQCSGDEK